MVTHDQHWSTMMIWASSENAIFSASFTVKAWWVHQESMVGLGMSWQVMRIIMRDRDFTRQLQGGASGYLRSWSISIPLGWGWYLVVPGNPKNGPSMGHRLGTHEHPLGLDGCEILQQLIVGFSFWMAFLPSFRWWFGFRWPIHSMNCGFDHPIFGMWAPHGFHGYEHLSRMVYPLIVERSDRTSMKISHFFWQLNHGVNHPWIIHITGPFFIAILVKWPGG